jgi:hypothetical protein
MAEGISRESATERRVEDDMYEAERRVRSRTFCLREDLALRKKERPAVEGEEEC